MWQLASIIKPFQPQKGFLQFQKRVQTYQFFIYVDMIMNLYSFRFTYISTYDNQASCSANFDPTLLESASVILTITHQQKLLSHNPNHSQFLNAYSLAMTHEAGSALAHKSKHFIVSKDSYPCLQKLKLQFKLTIGTKGYGHILSYSLSVCFFL